MTTPDVAVVDGLAIALVSALGVFAIAVSRRMFRFWRLFANLVQDWHGHPGDTKRGMPPQKSVPERLTLLEEHRANDSIILATLAKDTQRNGGVQATPEGKIYSGTSKDINTETLELLRRIDKKLGDTG